MMRLEGWLIKKGKTHPEAVASVSLSAPLHRGDLRKPLTKGLLRLQVLVFIALLLPCSLPAQSPQGDKVDLEKANAPDTTRILFVGNSFTFYWDVPGLLQQMAAKSPEKKKVFVHALTWGGQTLTYYWSRIEKKETTGNVESLLEATKWDYVVLQRWGDDDVTEIVPKFAELIRSKNPDTKILLYAWGGAGKITDEAKPPEKVQKAHEIAAEKSGATVVPVAWAWYRFRTEKPGVQDVAEDGWHPGVVRSYMSASALYATIFHETPVGLPVYEWWAWAPPEGKGKGRLSKEDAAYLQGLAWDAVQQYSNDPFFVGKRGTASIP